MVEGYDSIKGISLFALEPLDESRAALGQQVFQLGIGQYFASLLTEHMAVTGRIVALHDLFVELHRAFSALRAGDADTAVLKLVIQGEKFLYDTTRIVLKSLTEVVGIVFAPFNP